MEIHLLRHGQAEQSSPTGKDSDRALTIPGVAGVRRVVTQAMAADMQPTLILSSPYVRAVETAQAAARILHYEDQIIQCARATPDSSPADLWAELRQHEHERSILVVAHEPLLSSATSWMLGSSRIMIEFFPAMMVRIDFENVGTEPRGVLRRIFREDTA